MKRSLGLWAKRPSLFRLRSSAQSLSLPAMGDTWMVTPCRCAQPAARRRKWLSGHEVLKSVFSVASAAALSDPDGRQNEVCLWCRR